jgi:hypothetical protein
MLASLIKLTTQYKWNNSRVLGFKLFLIQFEIIQFRGASIASLIKLTTQYKWNNSRVLGFK